MGSLFAAGGITVNAPWASVTWGVVQGIDWQDEFLLTELGDPIPIPAGASFEFVVTPLPDRGPRIHTFTLASGLLVKDAATSRLATNVPGATIAAMPAGTWHHDFRMTTTDGVRMLTRGPFWVYPAGWSFPP